MAQSLQVNHLRSCLINETHDLLIAKDSIMEHALMRTTNKINICFLLHSLSSRQSRTGPILVIVKIRLGTHND